MPPPAPRPPHDRSKASHRPRGGNAAQPGDDSDDVADKMDTAEDLDLGQDEDLTLLTTPEDELEEDGAEHLRYTLSKNARTRLDKYLQNRLRHVSRHQIQKLIALGGVTVNGRAPKASTKLKKDDVVDVILPPRPTRELKAEPIPLDVIYEDDYFIVLNKHAGIIVHPARAELTGTLLNALAYHFALQRPPGVAPAAPEEGRVAGLSSVGTEDTRPGIVHRLDRNTTGVIVMAKKDEAHWLLARQFEHRTNLKAYLAVVHGCPDPPGGVIEQPIGKHPTMREAMAVRNDSHSRSAVTLYRVRERYRGYSLVELELKTGRTHQIRVHLSYMGFPIVGDLLYGGEQIGHPEIATPPRPAAARPNLVYARTKAEAEKLDQLAAAREDMLMTTPALHAALLRIKHPITDKEMTFTAPIPSPMRELIHILRQHPEPGPTVKEGWWVDMNIAMPETLPQPSHVRAKP